MRPRELRHRVQVADELANEGAALAVDSLTVDTSRALLALLVTLLLLVWCGCSPGEGAAHRPSDAGQDASDASHGHDASDASDASVGCATRPDPTRTEVCTDTGVVRGAVQDRVARYLGIPYAEAPEGSLRWRAPVARAPWDGVLDATKPGAICAQPGPSGEVVGAEDCLVLNVWTEPPSVESSPTAPLKPVFVFVHGGDNIYGSSYDNPTGQGLAYDGSAWAGAAVVVTINYRVGVLGFLSSPALAADGGAGNYGIMDLELALAWVQRNIQAFGGDPSQVLLGGQSAGADNVCALLASGRGEGLFRSALLVSGGGCSFVPSQVAAWTASAATRSLGCTGAANVASCLRSAPLSALVRVPGNSVYLNDPQSRYYVSVDGAVLSDDPKELLAAPGAHRVPVVMTTTSEEYAPLLDLILNELVTDQDSFRAALTRLFEPTTAAFVEANYAIEDYPAPVWALVAALGDYVFQCPNRRLARALVGAGFTVHRGVFAEAPSDPRLAPYGAGHGFDVPFLFGAFDGYAASAKEHALSERLKESYFVLALRGEPHPFDGVAWPQGAEESLVIREAPFVLPQFRGAQCDAWESFGLP